MEKIQTWGSICKWLDANHIHHLITTSKTLHNNISFDDSIWKELFLRPQYVEYRSKVDTERYQTYYDKMRYMCSFAFEKQSLLQRIKGNTIQNCRITKVEYRRHGSALYKAILLNDSIRNLCINNYIDSVCEFIDTIINSNKNIASLSINWPRDYDPKCDWSKNTSIKCIKLYACGRTKLDAFLNGIEKNSTIKSITLHCHGDEIDVLNRLPKIEFLFIENGKLDKMPTLADYIASNTSVRTFEIKYLHCKPEMILAFSKNKTIKRLVMGGNSSYFIQATNSIEDLTIKNTIESAHKILVALKNNKSITHVKFPKKKVHMHDLPFLEEVLTSNTTLQCIDLSENYIDLEEAPKHILNDPRLILAGCKRYDIEYYQQIERERIEEERRREENARRQHDAEIAAILKQNRRDQERIRLEGIQRVKEHDQAQRLFDDFLRQQQALPREQQTPYYRKLLLPKNIRKAKSIFQKNNDKRPTGRRDSL